MHKRASRILAATVLPLVVAGSGFPHIAFAAVKTWDGGGNPNFNWSVGANWDADAAPAATGDTLTFAGSTGLSANNDFITALANGGITFSAGAGSFNLGGNAITIGTAGGGGLTVLTQQSANNQVVSLNITLASGGGDRSVVMSGAGSLTLSGNLNFGNSWLFPTTTAGTIILSGGNSGDGKGSVISAGANSLRATIGNNVAGTQLVLGSDTALGNASSGDVGAGTAALKGIQARQNTSISTIGNRDLSAYAIAINAANVTFNGTGNLTMGHLINQGGSRDFWVTSSGTVTLQNSLSLSADQTGRSLYINLTGTGGMVVNGKVYDTFHSSGLTTGFSTLRKAGTGTLTLNGNSSYTGLTTIEGGTLKVGHANALGAGGSTAGTTLSGSSTLDLNGFTIAESVTNSSSGNKLANSSASAGGLTQDMTLFGDLTVDTTGDLNASRLIGNAIRTVTKTGAGTFTTGGTSHNNLANWVINNGTVVFANTSGFGADRGVTIAGGTLKLSGANSDLINNGESFTLNTGVFDLNGKAEAVAAIGGTGGFVRNTSSSAATLYVGGGVSGTSSASYAGVIENGTGTLNVTKEGSGTQTLTGVNTYSGNTTISAGAIALSGGASIANSPTINVAGGATFDVSAVSGGYTLGASQTLKGSGTITGAATLGGTVAPGNSIGTLTFSTAPTLNGTLVMELNAPASADKLVISSGTLAFNGTLTVTNTGGSLTNGNTFDLFDGSLAGNFTALNLPGGAGHWNTSDLNVGGTITFANANPTAPNIDLTVNQGESVSFTFAGSKFAITPDTDGDAVTVTSTGGSPTKGTAGSTVGSVSYTSTGAAGTDSFTYTIADSFGATATGTVNITVLPAGNGANITGISVSLPSATVMAQGIPGAVYSLQYTDSLTPVNWQNIAGTATASGNGVITLTDPVAANPGPRFYRTTYVSGP